MIILNMLGLNIAIYFALSFPLAFVTLLPFAFLIHQGYTHQTLYIPLLQHPPSLIKIPPSPEAKSLYFQVSISKSGPWWIPWYEGNFRKLSLMTLQEFQQQQLQSTEPLPQQRKYRSQWVSLDHLSTNHAYHPETKSNHNHGSMNNNDGDQKKNNTSQIHSLGDDKQQITFSNVVTNEVVITAGSDSQQMGLAPAVGSSSGSGYGVGGLPILGIIFGWLGVDFGFFDAFNDSGRNGTWKRLSDQDQSIRVKASTTPFYSLWGGKYGIDWKVTVNHERKVEVKKPVGGPNGDNNNNDDDDEIMEKKTELIEIIPIRRVRELEIKDDGDGELFRGIFEVKIFGMVDETLMV